MKTSIDGARSVQIKPVQGTYWPEFTKIAALTTLPFGVGMMILVGIPVEPSIIIGFAFGIISGAFLAPRSRQATLRISPAIPSADLPLALSGLGYHQESASPEASTWKTQEAIGRATRITVHQSRSETLIIGPTYALRSVNKLLAQESAIARPSLGESDAASSDHVGDTASVAPAIVGLTSSLASDEVAANTLGSSKRKRLVWIVAVLIALTGGAAAVAYGIFDTYAVRCSDEQVTQLVRTIVGNQILPKQAWKGTDTERANAFALTNVGTTGGDWLGRDCFGNLSTNPSGLDLMASRFDKYRATLSGDDKKLATLLIAPIIGFRTAREGMRLEYRVQRLDDGRVNVRILSTY